MTTALSIAEMIEISRSAQQKLALFTQSQLDDIVKIIARTVYDHAELLARMAVDETRMGVYEDKVAKNRGKSKTIWNALKSKINSPLTRSICAVVSVPAIRRPEKPLTVMAAPERVISTVPRV